MPAPDTNGATRLSDGPTKQSKRPTLADREQVSRRLAETVQFLRDQEACLAAIRGGGYYASVVRTWIKFLEGRAS